MIYVLPLLIMFIGPGDILAQYFPIDDNPASAEITIPNYTVLSAKKRFQKYLDNIPAIAEEYHDLKIYPQKKLKIYIALDNRANSKLLKTELFDDWVKRLNSEMLKSCTKEQKNYAITISEKMNRRQKEINRLAEIIIVDMTKESFGPSECPAVKISYWQELPKLSNHGDYLDLIEYICEHYYFEELQEKVDIIEREYLDEKINIIWELKGMYSLFLKEEFMKTDNYKQIHRCDIYNNYVYNSTINGYYSIEDFGFDIDESMFNRLPTFIQPKSKTGFIIQYIGSKEYDLPNPEGATENDI